MHACTLKSMVVLCVLMYYIGGIHSVIYLEDDYTSQKVTVLPGPSKFALVTVILSYEDVPYNLTAKFA